MTKNYTINGHYRAITEFALQKIKIDHYLFVICPLIKIYEIIQVVGNLMQFNKYLYSK